MDRVRPLAAGTMDLGGLLRLLLDGDQVPLVHSGLDATGAVELGLSLSDGVLRWPEGCSPLQCEAIVDAMRRAMPGAGRAGFPEVHVFPAIGSTNDWLKELAASGSIAGYLATAECQTAGRGRLGRRWSSPVGGSIAVSYGLRLGRRAEELGGLSLVAGLAVLDALNVQGTVRPSLKWPNDLLVEGAKLGGILIEIVKLGGSFVEVVIGIGMNYRLTADVAVQIDKEVTDLYRLGESRNRSELIGLVGARLHAFVAGFEREGFAPFQSAYDQHHAYGGRRVRLLGGGTGAELTGTVTGVNRDGALLLDTETGPCAVNSGELSLREA